ncbi:MAG: hypothetical protein M3N41_12855, partial [Acidobacteriota bacterium]|nr:hypothetical protein [Acidobacteriota bacterium]
MSTRTQQRISWGLVAWCIVFLAVLAGRPSFTNASLPVRGVADPVVALQMARDPGDVEAVLGDAPSPDREVMRVKQYVDFGLIVGYFGLALAMGAALRRGGRGRTGLLLMTITSVAAFHDVRENLITLRVLNLGLSQVTTAMLDQLRLISMGKWVFLAAASVVLAAVTVRQRAWYLRTAAALGGSGAALTMAGLFSNSLLVWGGLLMALGLLLTAATLKG